MSFEMIRIGDKVEVKGEDIRVSVAYPSKVVGILNAAEQVLSIYIPALGGQNLNMQLDKDYSVLIYTGQSLIKFRGVFEGYFKEDMNYFAAMRLLDEGVRMQRREFFRFTCMLAMKFAVMDYGDNETAKLLFDSGYAEMFDGIVRDIGGGGLRFTTNKELELAYPIQCTIMLGTTTMLINGRLLEKQYMPKSSLKFQYRALFLDVSPQAQEEIVNYIFSEQRKQRKIKTPEN